MAERHPWHSILFQNKILSNLLNFYKVCLPDLEHRHHPIEAGQGQNCVGHGRAKILHIFFATCTVFSFLQVAQVLRELGTGSFQFSQEGENFSILKNGIFCILCDVNLTGNLTGISWKLLTVPHDCTNMTEHSVVTKHWWQKVRSIDFSFSPEIAHFLWSIIMAWKKRLQLHFFIFIVKRLNWKDKLYVDLYTLGVKWNKILFAWWSTDHCPRASFSDHSSTFQSRCLAFYLVWNILSYFWHLVSWMAESW